MERHYSITTTDAGPPVDTIYHVRKTVRKGTRAMCWDLTYYIFFVLLFAGVTLLPFARVSEDAYYFIQVVDGALVNRAVPDPAPSFSDIHDGESFWHWLRGPFLTTAYGLSPWEEDREDCPFNLTCSPEASGVRPRTMLSSPLLLGIRLRQERVAADACVRGTRIGRNESSSDGGCAYPKYRRQRRGYQDCDWPHLNDPDITDAETREAVCAGEDSGFQHRTVEQLGSIYYAGFMAEYKGDGYALMLGNLADANARIQTLLLNDWIDALTRAVYVEFSLYLPNKDLVCAVRLAVEFHPSGHTRPRTFFSVFELNPYDNWRDYLRAFCEAVLGLVIVGLFISEVYRLKQGGSLQDMGMTFYIIAVVNNVTIAVALALKIYTIVLIKELKDTIRDVDLVSNRPEDLFLPTLKAGVWSNNTRSFISIVALFAWLRVFRYTANLPRLGIVGHTIKRSLPAIASFVSMSLLLFVGFSQSFYMAFFATVDGYQSLFGSMISLLRFTLGDYDYEALREENRVLAPLLFCTLLIVVFFVWVNVVIAIVSNSYDEEVKLSREFVFDEQFPEDSTGYGPEFDAGAYHSSSEQLQPVKYSRHVLQSLTLFRKETMHTVAMADYDPDHAVDHEGVQLRVGSTNYASGGVTVQAIYFHKDVHTHTSAMNWWARYRQYFLVGDAFASGISQGFSRRGRRVGRALKCTWRRVVRRGQDGEETYLPQRGQAYAVGRPDAASLQRQSSTTLSETRVDLPLIIQQHLTALADRTAVQHRQLETLVREA